MYWGRFAVSVQVLYGLGFARGAALLEPMNLKSPKPSPMVQGLGPRQSQARLGTAGVGPRQIRKNRKVKKKMVPATITSKMLAVWFKASQDDRPKA